MKRKIVQIVRSVVKAYTEGWSTLDPAVAASVLGAGTAVGRPLQTV